MGFIAVLVNCALIGLSGQVHRMLPDMTAIQTVLLIVTLEVSSYNNNIINNNTGHLGKSKIIYYLKEYIIILIHKNEKNMYQKPLHY